MASACGYLGIEPLSDSLEGEGERIVGFGAGGGWAQQFDSNELQEPGASDWVDSSSADGGTVGTSEAGLISEVVASGGLATSQSEDEGATTSGGALSAIEGAGASGSSAGSGAGGSEPFDDDDDDDDDDTNSGGAGSVGSGSCSSLGVNRAWSFMTDDSLSFDTSMFDRWGLDTVETLNTGSIDWTGELGNSRNGALALEFTDESALNRQLYPRILLESLDLSLALVTAHVYVEESDAVVAKIFVQSGDELNWANGEEVRVSAGQWTCIRLDVQKPAYADALFDPSDVVRLGVQLFVNRGDPTTNVIHAYLDDVSF